VGERGLNLQNYHLLGFCLLLVSGFGGACAGFPLHSEPYQASATMTVEDVGGLGNENSWGNSSDRNDQFVGLRRAFQCLVHLFAAEDRGRFESPRAPEQGGGCVIWCWWGW